MKNCLPLGNSACLLQDVDWEIANYPVVIREEKVDRYSVQPPSREIQYRYLASIVNWSVLGGGDTPDRAIAELVRGFAKLKENRRLEGKAMPRPGTKVPIEFAPSNRVSAYPELTSDFIQRVLELDWAFVSDESSLWDFHADGTNDVLNSKIKAVYGVDASDVESGNVADILDRIAESRTRISGHF